MDDNTLDPSHPVHAGMALVRTPMGSFAAPSPVAALVEAQRTTNVDLDRQVEELRAEVARLTASGQAPDGTVMVPGFGTFADTTVIADMLTRAQTEARERGARADDLARQVLQERRNLEEFKSRVRDYAIEHQSEAGWCDEGLNRALLDLDLDPLIREFDVTFRVWQSVTVTVEAVDADAAERLAEDQYDGDDLARNYADSYGWECEVDEVTETDD
jgi:cell division septum initiation protein DivIVA